MSNLPTQFCICLSILLLAAVQRPSLAQESATPFRSWTDHTGRTIEARLLAQRRQVVELERRDGRRGVLRLAQLSTRDQRQVRYDAVQALLSSQEVQALSDRLIAKNVVNETRTENYTVTRMVPKCVTETFCYRGRWVTRRVLRQVPVSEIRTRARTVAIPRINDEPLFEDPNSSNVGVGYVELPLTGLPNAAGGRASKVQVAAINYLPNNVFFEVGEVDRLLETQSDDYQSPAAGASVEEKIRLVASVSKSQADNVVKLTYLLLRRNAANGTLSNNKSQLDFDAQQRVEAIRDRLK